MEKPHPRKLQLHEWKGAVDISGTLGETLDKQLAYAEAQQQQRRGAKLGLRQQAINLQSVHAFADQEFKEGVLDLEALALAKRYVTLCITATENASKQQEAEEVAMGGKVAALKETLEIVGNHHKVAKSRFDQLNTPLTPEEKKGERKPRGGRQSAAERRAKAAPKKAAKKATKKAAKKTSRKRPAKKS